MKLLFKPILEILESMLYTSEARTWRGNGNAFIFKRSRLSGDVKIINSNGHIVELQSHEENEIKATLNSSRKVSNL